MTSVTEVQKEIEELKGQLTGQRGKILEHARQSPGLDPAEINRDIDMALSLPASRGWKEAERSSVRGEIVTRLNRLQALAEGPLAEGTPAVENDSTPNPGPQVTLTSSPISTPAAPTATVSNPPSNPTPSQQGAGQPPSNPSTVGGGIGIDSFNTKVNPGRGWGYGGIQVTVRQGSPAAVAGLKTGDEVLYVNGVSVSSGNLGHHVTFALGLSDAPVGSEIELIVRSPGETNNDPPRRIRVKKSEGFVDAMEVTPLGSTGYGSVRAPAPVPGAPSVPSSPGTRTGSGQTNQASAQYDISKVSLESLIGRTYAWHHALQLPGIASVFSFVGGRRKVGKDVEFDFAGRVNGAHAPELSGSFKGDDGQALQLGAPSELLTQHAMTMDENGNLVRYTPPPALSKLPAITSDGGRLKLDPLLGNPWNQVVIYGVGQVRTVADVDSLVSKREEVNAKIRAEIVAFLDNPSLGDNFPIYIVEPGGVIGSINSTRQLKPRTLYISRDKLLEFVKGLK